MKRRTAPPTALLVGMPRSGTSWLSQIVDSSPDVRYRLSPLFSYAFKNLLDENSTAAEWQQLFAEVFESANRFMDQTERREKGDYPTFARKERCPSLLAIKMTRFHQLLRPALARLPELRVVAIVRHPCGAIHSWLSTPGEFPADANPAEEWRTGRCRKTSPEEFWGFTDWLSVTRLHQALEYEFADRLLLISYERLVASAESETRRLFDFLGLAWTPQTAEFLVHSQGRQVAHSHAVFKLPAVASRWRDELDPRIRDAILAETDPVEFGRFLG